MDSLKSEKEACPTDCLFPLFSAGPLPLLPTASPLKYDAAGNDDGGMSDYRPKTLDDDDDDDVDGPVRLRRDWQWCLLALDGNATIVQLRRDDFVRYLRMNVASAAGADYDDVRFNAVSFAPGLLVNITLDFAGSRGDRAVAALSNLARHNDTLLDLSGSHFNLTGFLPRAALMAPKPVESSSGDGADPREVEALVYMSVGAAVAFLLTASLIFAVCQCIGNGGRPKDGGMVRSDDSRGNLLAASASQYSLDEYNSSVGNGSLVGGGSVDGGSRRSSSRRPPPHQPKMIYSRSFCDGIDPRHAPHRRYTPVDDNVLAPLAAFEPDENGDEEEGDLPRFVHHPRRPNGGCSQPQLPPPRPPPSDSQSDILVAPWAAGAVTADEADIGSPLLDSGMPGLDFNRLSNVKCFLQIRTASILARSAFRAATPPPTGGPTTIATSDTASAARRRNCCGNTGTAAAAACPWGPSFPRRTRWTRPRRSTPTSPLVGPAAA